MSGPPPVGTVAAGKNEVRIGPAAPPEASVQAVPSPEPVASLRLPVPGKHLFGRKAETERLDAAWADPDTHVITIIAIGGAGKTALVDDWLKRMARDGFRGAVRIYGRSFYSQGSSNTASGDTFIAEALRWFGDTDPTAGSAWDRGERLARLVKQQRTLLVLDGLEPLQWPPGHDEGKIRDHGIAALVRGLADGGSGLCVISSRFPVADLASREGGRTPRIDLDRLSPEDGGKLLAVLGARGPTAELEEAAREMKGHALALTLLGSYLADACGGDIRKRKEIGPLEGDVTGGDHAKHAMAAYARWFGDGPEVAVLRLLGLFDRPADAGCIRALREAPAIPKLTDALVGMSDPQWNQTLAKVRRAHLVAEASGSEPGMVDAHPLVREHFGVRLREEAAEAWRAGHGRLFEHLQKAAPDFPEDTVAMAPLYAAVVHGCHAGRRQEALTTVLKGRVDRGNEAFNEKKLGAFGAELGMLAGFFDVPWTRLAPGLAEAAEGFMLGDASFALRALGRLDEAVEPTRLGLEKHLGREAWADAARVAGNLGQLHLSRGAVTDAVVAARRSVELADRSGDRYQPFVARTVLADALHQAGSPDEARALFDAAEARQKTEQPTYPLLYSVRGFHYCDLLLGQGQIENVLDRARQTLAWVTKEGWLLDIALDHLSLGRAHLLVAVRDRTGDVALARAELNEAVTGLRQAGQQDELPRGLLARAELHAAAGDLPTAERDLDEALSIATRSGMRLHEADAQIGFARLHLARRECDAARASLAVAKGLVERTGYHRRDREVAELEAELDRARPAVPASLASCTAPPAFESLARPDDDQPAVAPLHAPSILPRIPPPRKPARGAADPKAAEPLAPAIAVMGLVVVIAAALFALAQRLRCIGGTLPPCSTTSSPGCSPPAPAPISDGGLAPAPSGASPPVPEPDSGFAVATVTGEYAGVVLELKFLRLDRPAPKLDAGVLDLGYVWEFGSSKELRYNGQRKSPDEFFQRNKDHLRRFLDNGRFGVVVVGSASREGLDATEQVALAANRATELYGRVGEVWQDSENRPVYTLNLGLANGIRPTIPHCESSPPDDLDAGLQGVKTACERAVILIVILHENAGVNDDSRREALRDAMVKLWKGEAGPPGQRILLYSVEKDKGDFDMFELRKGPARQPSR